MVNKPCNNMHRGKVHTFQHTGRHDGHDDPEANREAPVLDPKTRLAPRPKGRPKGRPMKRPAGSPPAAAEPPLAPPLQQQNPKKRPAKCTQPAGPKVYKSCEAKRVYSKVYHQVKTASLLQGSSADEASTIAKAAGSQAVAALKASP